MYSSNYSFLNSRPEIGKNNGYVPSRMDYAPALCGDGSYEKYQERSKLNYNRSTLAARASGHGCDKSEVNKLFFSDENVKRIQKKIQSEFKRQSGIEAEFEQDDADLNIAMIAVYNKESRDLPNHVVRQVKQLNEKTVKYVVPDMITNAKQYFGYLKDINEPLKPMMRPMNVNNAGRKTLPSLTTVWR